MPPFYCVDLLFKLLRYTSLDKLYDFNNRADIVS